MPRGFVKPNMDIRVRVRMIERGLTQGEMARQLGVSREAVNGVIRGRWTSARLQIQIAGLLGFPVQTMFPTHKPNRHMGRRGDGSR